MGSVFKGNNLLVEVLPYKSCRLLGRESERNSRVAYPESIPILLKIDNSSEES